MDPLPSGIANNGAVVQSAISVRERDVPTRNVVTYLADGDPREGTQRRLDRFFMAAEKIAFERLTSARCKSRLRVADLFAGNGVDRDNARARLLAREKEREKKMRGVERTEFARSARSGARVESPEAGVPATSAGNAESTPRATSAATRFTRLADTLTQLIKRDL